MPANTTGQWGALQVYPYVPAHAILLSDGKLLTFGTEQAWMPGSAGHWYHSIFDPATGQNTLLDHSGTTTSDIFCSAAMIIPGTNKVMMSGGGIPNNTIQGVGSPDVNIFDPANGHIMPSGDGDMAFPRWYPTMISLPTGQIVVMGGTQYTTAHIGMPIPEIYTPGEGWRQLTGASENDFTSEVAFYPKAFLNAAGDIIYFANGKGADGVQEVNLLDPSGNGSLTQIGTVPFTTGWGQPAIMYAKGKVLTIASNGDLWTMDINGAAPIFAKTSANVGTHIHWSNMSVLADGSVIITGGGNQGDSPAGADRAPALWNPATGQVTILAPEAEDRLYHSAGILLSDGTVMSMGGTADPNKNYQIFKPPYLFDANGNEAVRPVITSTPKEIVPGEAFTITVDNAAAITKLTFTKTGAVTHSANLESGFFELSFTKGANNTLTAKVPDGVGDLSAGNWMPFAWNNKGVPSKAPILTVEPTLTHFEANGSGGVPIGTGPTSGPELVVDGGFEASPAGPGKVGSAWTLTGTGGVDTTVARAAEGGKYFALDGWGTAHDGALSQTINTVVGQTYTLKLKASVYGSSTVDAQLKLETLNGATVINVNTASVKKGVAEYAMIFTATSAHTTIKLSDISPKGQANFDIDIDSISVKASVATVPELIVDGGFELSPAGPGKVGSAWTLTGSAGVDTTVARAAEGGKYFAFDGWSTAHDAALSQTINTVAGQTYTLKFKANIYAPSATTDAQIKMDALNGSTAVETKTVAIKSGMAEYSMAFTATSAQTTIKLSDISPRGQANFDIDIDAVSVKAGGTVTPPHLGDNLLSNASFETFTGDLAAGAYKLFKNGEVGAWQSSTNQIELWNYGHNGMNATDGRILTEIDAYNGTLSQTVKTETGKYYGVSFDFAGRPGYIASSKMEVLWNSAIIGTVTPANSTMTGYHFHATGTGGNDVLAFRSVAGDNDSVGGLLDKVELIVSSHPVSSEPGSLKMISAAADYVIDTDKADRFMGDAGGYLKGYSDTDHFVENAAHQWLQSDSLVNLIG